jgi:hypothetical protein
MQLQASITSGLVIRQTMPLKTILAPLANELSKCFWLIDTQSGPFRDHHLLGKEAVYEKLFFETDACRKRVSESRRPSPRQARKLAWNRGRISGLLDLADIPRSFPQIQVAELDRRRPP